ncbi:hypothetical protein CEUSTIGMA_g9166.t1 [Chlamydomonas eustigma]|uniref:CCHC-type domain-containing protein n=1 Tax=Chlamydomonas eustigma TaxID=1157962 RepID=A0A250XF73_9CHLO|nr:hypothetical protein CEUSTIGMA_g9166.t1 [Chlamydomonas eustigma]|eukprot:GAX81738.1 hypothetical protein CEUSTIGMA_g9166.t1 [Chlamydomonas eustigma]
MSQKGVSEIFHKEASTNPQEAAIFDRLWGTLGNNVGTLFRSILTEAKIDDGYQAEEAATKLRMDEFNSKSARGRNASSKHNVEAPGFGGFGHHESGPSSSSHGRGHDSRGQHYGKGKQNAGGRSGRQQHPSGGRGGGKPHVAAPAHPPNAPPPRNRDITCLLCQETGHMMRECPYKDIISSAISNHKRAVAPGLLAVTKAPKFVTTAAGAGLELGDSNSFVGGALDQRTTTSLTDPSSIISNLLQRDRKGVFRCQMEWWSPS